MAQEINKIIQGDQKRVSMRFFDENDVLIDPDALPTLSAYDNSATPIEDADSVTLTDVTATKKSTGIYFWLFKPKASESLGYVSFWWKATIGTAPVRMDQPQVVEIIAQPTAGITVAGFCTPAEAREILFAATGELDWDDEKIYKYIKIADEQIKSELFKAYAPSNLSSSVPMVKQLSQWKTAEIILNVIFAANATPAISTWADNYKNWYDGKIVSLKATGTDEIPLLDANGDPVTKKSSNQFESTTKDYHTTFDMEDAEDQLIDPDRLEAESDERDT